MSDNDDWFERARRELEESESVDRPNTGGQGIGERDESNDPDDSGAEITEEFPKETSETGRRGERPSPGADDFGFAEFGDASGADDFEFVEFSDSGETDDPFGGTADETSAADEFAAELEDTDLDSDIPRIELGIDGLDSMILGGVPDRSLISVIGSAGTGKTTFGLQFLEHGLARGERGVYITLEEGRDGILSTAEEKGWPFGQYVEDGRLAVVAMDPIEMANSLSSIRSDLTRLVDDFGADRLVLDSVSLLEMMYDHPAKRRSQVFEFTRSLEEVGVTTLLTSEASEESPYNSRYGIVEYLTDAVFVLRYVRTSNFQGTRLAVEIQKIRDANHSRETKPYEITNHGIDVYQQANLF